MWTEHMKARVTVTLKSGILDPQGKAIEGALKSLGVDGINSVRQGKVFDIELAGADKAKAVWRMYGQRELPALRSPRPRDRGASRCIPLWREGALHGLSIAKPSPMVNGRG